VYVVLMVCKLAADCCKDTLIICIIFLCSAFQLLISANVVSSLPSHVTLMVEAICSSETSVLTRATRRNIPIKMCLDNPQTPISTIAFHHNSD
jgi:hypothetical protein